MENTQSKLIHAAVIQLKGHGPVSVFLRELKPYHYVWFQEDASGQENETPIFASSIEEALRLAKNNWKEESFRTLNCGFRYTLPERDEHGTNALLCHMGASYASPNGVYFDESIGNNCIVHNASTEARELWKRKSR